MENNLNILNELKQISPLLAGIGNTNVFTVPNNYFNSLADIILMQVNEEKNSLPATSPQPIMQVPQGYFENLADTILSKIKNIEVEKKSAQPSLMEIEDADLSPMLQSLQHKNVFTVPQGYFEALLSKILSAVKPAQAKVVTIMPTRNTNFLKYAAAAVFTGVMALGVYKFVSVTSPGKSNLPEYVIDGVKIKNVDEAMAKISDDDIIKYLQDNGENIDAAVVASTINENELPSQEDYLNDEKTLDNYLDNANLNDFKN